mgnify:CR=1 FL=1
MEAQNTEEDNVILEDQANQDYEPDEEGNSLPTITTIQLINLQKSTTMRSISA